MHAADLSLLQRTRGRADLMLERQGAGYRIAGLHQSGSAKLFLPRVHRTVPEVVFLNTSGGLTGGDRLHYGLTVGAGAAAVATTQTAERAYASAGGRAEVTVALTVGAGGRLDWMPQETILFDGAALDRRTLVEMAPDASVLLVELLVLGRAAMGETVRRLSLSDWREVRRGGIPVLIEPLKLSDATLLGQPALLGSARAVASVALVAPDAEARLGLVRAVLGSDGVRGAASAWGGKCILRLMADEALPLRRALVKVLSALRDGPLPRVWQNG